MSRERADWIEFVPVWDDTPDAPEITIELLDPEPVPPSNRTAARVVSMIVALVGLVVGVLIAVIGAADGIVSLPGGDPLPSAVLVGGGIGFACIEAIVLVLAWRRVRSG